MFGLQERLVYGSIDRASKPPRILIADDPQRHVPVCANCLGADGRHDSGAFTLLHRQ